MATEGSLVKLQREDGELSRASKQLNGNSPIKLPHSIRKVEEEKKGWTCLCFVLHGARAVSPILQGVLFP